VLLVLLVVTRRLLLLALDLTLVLPLLVLPLLLVLALVLLLVVLLLLLVLLLLVLRAALGAARALGTRRARQDRVIRRARVITALLVLRLVAIALRRAGVRLLAVRALLSPRAARILTLLATTALRIRVFQPQKQMAGMAGRDRRDRRGRAGRAQNDREASGELDVQCVKEEFDLTLNTSGETDIDNDSDGCSESAGTKSSDGIRGRGTAVRVTGSTLDLGQSSQDRGVNICLLGDQRLEAHFETGAQVSVNESVNSSSECGVDGQIEIGQRFIDGEAAGTIGTTTFRFRHLDSLLEVQIFFLVSSTRIECKFSPEIKALR